MRDRADGTPARICQMTGSSSGDGRLPLRPPEGLQAAGRRAWRQAAIAGPDARDVIDAYAHAVDRAHQLRRAWIAAGRPLTALGGATGRATVTHPLMAAIDRADEVVRRLAHELALTPAAAGSKQRGRPPGRDPIAALGLGGLRVAK